MGTPRFELGTSALSGLRSNQLSYVPKLLAASLERNGRKLLAAFQQDSVF
jgi:hypothetical protein